MLKIIVTTLLATVLLYGLDSANIQIASLLLFRPTRAKLNTKLAVGQVLSI